MGSYRPGGKEVDETRLHHTVVVRDGNVYDQWNPNGIGIEDYKNLWDYGDDMNFGF